MLIDLEELAGEIASKVDGAGITPVIEKEIVHYEIIRSLGRNGLLQDITFQGGTSLRLCYGSQRYSEDLDFVAGDNLLCRRVIHRADAAFPIPCRSRPHARFR